MHFATANLPFSVDAISGLATLILIVLYVLYVRTTYSLLFMDYFTYSLPLDPLDNIASSFALRTLCFARYTELRQGQRCRFSQGQVTRTC